MPIFCDLDWGTTNRQLGTVTVWNGPGGAEAYAAEGFEIKDGCLIIIGGPGGNCVFAPGSWTFATFSNAIEEAKGE